MLKPPGGPAPEEQQRWRRLMEEMAMERWGQQRLNLIHPVLHKTADAVATMMSLELLSDDAPGFYLPVFQADGDWRVQ